MYLEAMTNPSFLLFVLILLLIGVIGVCITNYREVSREKETTTHRWRARSRHRKNLIDVPIIHHRWTLGQGRDLENGDESISGHG